MMHSNEYNQDKKPLQKQRNNGMKNHHQNGSYELSSSNYSKPKRIDISTSTSDMHGCKDSTEMNNNNSNNSSSSNNNRGHSDAETLNRKYSIDYLHRIGNHYKMTANTSTQKAIDDANLLAFKMALDNSGYFNHVYSMNYGNQLLLPQQQQNPQQQQQQQQQPQPQQIQQSYARYQQQQIQRMRMFHRQENFQRVVPQQSQHMYESDPSVPRHFYNQQQQQQVNHQTDQRSLHNGYYHQNTSASYNNNSNSSNSNSNHRSNKRENNRKNRVDRNYGNKKTNGGGGDRQAKTEAGNRDENERRKNSSHINRSTSEYRIQYRSLSPTPPSSVNSTGSVSLDKSEDKDLSSNNGFTSFETVDDSESTTSATSSVPSALSYSSDVKDFSLSKIQLSASDTSVRDSSINSWINNNFSINNGLSVSAEQLNVKSTESHIVMKRPPSAGKTLSHLTVPRHVSLPPYDPAYPFDYYLARIDQCDIRSEPPNLRCNSPWDMVSKQIWVKFLSFQQTRETYRSKMMLWKELYEFVKGFPLIQHRACPKWGLFLVGSTISGFALETSDMDMCLVLKKAQRVEADPRTEALVTLSALKSYLMDLPNSFKQFYLINAKVPILRFRDLSNTIEVDLNYNNCVGVRNTHLLYCYAQLDWRLRPLALIVKLWAQFHNINDARNSTISSYSLVLMAIHFLQSAVSPPVLPCLHKMFPNKFQVLHDITTIDMMESLDVNWRSENMQPLGELFLRFLDYYSNFDYSKYAISIRTGGVLPIEECRNAKSLKNDVNHWLTLCIEEPFDLTNTARSTYDGEIFEKIKNVFFRSWRLLNETKTINCLFQEPLFVHQTPQHQPPLIPHIHNQINLLNDMNYIVYPNSPINSPIMPAASEIAS